MLFIGKTIECIAVINANKRKGTFSTALKTVVSFKETAMRKFRYEVKQKNERQNDDYDFGIKRKKKPKKYEFKEVEKEYTYYKGKGTLIIGPVSLIGVCSNCIYPSEHTQVISKYSQNKSNGKMSWTHDRMRE